ncbi:MAG: lasso peptide biosynthesis B2 protein, partial [Sphingomonas sp.]
SWLARRLWSSRDRCLPRSLALAHALRASGSAARLVLGVALNPFTAHAWVQDGDRVVNDTLDHAALFTPILVT